MAIDIIEVEINDLKMDLAKNCRANPNNEVIANYAELFTEEVEMPPLEAFLVGKEIWLVDGYHRCMGAMQAGKKKINVAIYEGDEKAALRTAVSANATHGLRRTNADKQQAVRMAFSDKEIRGYSANLVAKLCKVSQPTVAKVREEMKEEGVKFPKTTVGMDGKARRCSHEQPSEDDQDTPPSSGEAQSDMRGSQEESSEENAVQEVSDETAGESDLGDEPTGRTDESQGVSPEKNQEVTQEKISPSKIIADLKAENAALKSQIEDYEAKTIILNRTRENHLKDIEEKEKKIEALNDEIKRLEAKLAEAGFHPTPEASQTESNFAHAN
ncbi:hypothetical protein Dalk_2606 [Desulfatibacillum aliphaticivorans]|uniref:ParB domain protein nuclease n=1 Tax=Desulfatibacillum aliphaticivorans TaxID=218208 RepID=B8FIQ8_DESAL|nr:hypothetical protein [Desulfatibacillum aliphaticivorans]ACL04299.1 hypothetical protein Dalk_2606 [Desulfatibacillum aliphaticivorans]